MNNKTIEVTVSPTGDVFIEAVGFKGTGCEAATKYLEEALGVKTKRVKKPEYLQSNTVTAQQKVGQ